MPAGRSGSNSKKQLIVPSRYDPAKDVIKIFGRAASITTVSTSSSNVVIGCGNTCSGADNARERIAPGEVPPGEAGCSTGSFFSFINTVSG